MGETGNHLPSAVQATDREPNISYPRVHENVATAPYFVPLTRFTLPLAGGASNPQSVTKINHIIIKIMVWIFFIIHHCLIMSNHIDQFT